MRRRRAGVETVTARGLVDAVAAAGLDDWRQVGDLEEDAGVPGLPIRALNVGLHHRQLCGPPWRQDDRLLVASDVDAMAVAEAMAERLASLTTGGRGRNHELNTAAFNLGRLGALGVLDEATARVELLGACARNGLITDDGEGPCGRTFDSGWSAGLEAQGSTS